jgi:hypothetical protein
VKHFGGAQPAAQDALAQSAQYRFDFWEFRHREKVTSDE